MWTNLKGFLFHRASLNLMMLGLEVDFTSPAGNTASGDKNSILVYDFLIACNWLKLDKMKSTLFLMLE